MAQPPTGPISKILTGRPLLANSILGFGVTALAAVGIRQAGGVGGVIDAAIVAALIGIFFPAGVSAIGVSRTGLRLSAFATAFLLICGLIIFGDGRVLAPAGINDGAILKVALGLLAFFFVARALAGGALALSALSPMGAARGAAGGLGYLALQAGGQMPQAALVFAMAMGFSASVGFGVAADFARYFALGHSHLHATAAAGHAAIAPGAFAILTGVAYFAVNSFNTNYNAVDWSALWVGFASLVIGVAVAVCAVVGSIALSAQNEQNAVDENHRQRLFAKAWKPVRLAAPPATAAAVVAIAAVFGLIAVFEAGAPNMWSLSVFLFLVWIAAGVCFVSLRAAIFIVLLLSFAIFLTGYVYAIAGLPPIALSEKLLALAFCAIALGHLSVGWRDAADVWTRASDVAESALSDGAGRYLYAIAVGAASLLVAAAALSWPQGAASALYLVISAAFIAILAPPMMIALSARLGGAPHQLDADL